MKLEVGKYYKNLHKEKVRVLLMKKNGDFVLYNEKHDTVVINDQNHVDYYLISEWVEPVEHEVDVWFYKRDGDGALQASTVNHSNVLNAIAKVKVKFTEGEGL